jgi:hypothetical protein
MNKNSLLALSVLLLLLMAACQPAVGLTVSNPWARPGIAGGNSGAFFVIENPGEADTLLSAASDISTAVELHRTVMEGDVMQMQPQESVPVPAGETVAFQPGGLHVMLIGLKADLAPGDTFELRLIFEMSGEIVLQVEVRQP